MRGPKVIRHISATFPVAGVFQLTDSRYIGKVPALYSTPKNSSLSQKPFPASTAEMVIVLVQSPVMDTSQKHMFFATASSLYGIQAVRFVFGIPAVSVSSDIWFVTHSRLVREHFGPIGIRVHTSGQSGSHVRVETPSPACGMDAGSSCPGVRQRPCRARTLPGGSESDWLRTD